jgi:hypothetical protein
VDFFSSEEAWKHLISFGVLMKNKRYANLRHEFWLATTWCLWCTRNKIMFKEVVNLQFLVGHRQIIYIFWIWFIE